MKFLNMYDVSVAHVTASKAAPSTVERTLLVLADSEEAACKLVPSDQRVLRVKCSFAKARSAGGNRIIGFRGRPLAAAVKRALPADHPCSGPHPTD